MARRRTWTDDDLRVAVASATSLNGVFALLGLAVGGSAWRRMQAHIVRLGLDTSHWIAHGVHPGRRGAKRPVPIDDDALRRLLPDARSVAQVIVGLGLDPSNGSSYRRVRRRIEDLGLPTEHLVGQAWGRGLRRQDRPPRPLAEVLIKDAAFTGRSSKLRDRLVAEGLLAWTCAVCGLASWNGQRAPLQLDHVNGDPTDNQLHNLRLLCPNCHAQTPTYCGRNIGNGYSPPSGGG